MGGVTAVFPATFSPQNKQEYTIWSVLDWNEPAIRFYKSLGGQVMAEWQIFRVTGEALTQLAQGTA